MLKKDIWVFYFSDMGSDSYSVVGNGSYSDVRNDSYSVVGNSSYSVVGNSSCSDVRNGSYPAGGFFSQRDVDAGVCRQKYIEPGTEPDETHFG